MEYVRMNDVLATLHNIGGCDAEPGSWADGWDKAIDEAIRLVSKMGNHELEFIWEFAQDSDFNYQLAQKQLRSLWTAYCFHNNIGCDTRRYDESLRTVWDVASENNTCTWKDNPEELTAGIDQFGDFMCGEIV